MLTRWIPDSNERASFVRWALVALALHLVAAVCTAGWFNYDEHWQILEFANAFLGRTKTIDLPWEYAARARPALQPMLYAGIEKLLLDLGITSPFVFADVFRIVTALAAWGATMLAGVACLGWFPNSPARRWVAPTLALAWFLPYLHARTSSENASELTFLAGFALLTLATDTPRDRRSISFLAVGFLFGLSFEFRYQAAFMVAGALLWSLAVARVGARAFAMSLLGLALALLLGTAMDRIFYGAWVLAPWNYFRVNIIEHRASSFGTDPWWTYLTLAFERLAPPLSLLVCFGVGWELIRRPRSLAAWCIGPFLAAHFLIGHKEFRFLFPLATLAVLVTLRALDDVRASGRGRWVRVVFWLLLAEDVFLLAGSALRPSQATMPLYEYIWAIQPPPATIYFKGQQPYQNLKDLSMHFYRPSGLTMVDVGDYPKLAEKLHEGPLWFVTRGFHLPAEAAQLQQECSPEARTIPEWMTHFNFTHWLDRTPVWTLYRCRLD